MRLTDKEIKILKELREYAEDETNDGFGTVYLSNCESEGTKEFAGVLGSLEKKGLYYGEDRNDAVFGYVKLEEGAK